ncbi:MAG: NADH-quinone oxidoreductase subunit N, partial [Actinomycetota bacterium]|nr:NADH-quinone oxidoreductase subunit N [Actinomycetota bacterium]
MPVGDVAGEIALVLGAAVIIIVVLFVDRRRQWIGAPIAVAACGVSAGLIAVRLATTAQKLTWEGSWSLDRAAGWAELVILATTVITVALS